MTEYPLCSDCVMTSHVVGGITVTHPDKLKVLWDDLSSARAQYYATTDRWGRCGLMFDVMTFKRGNVAVFRDRRLKREHVIAERELNGWKVVTLQPHPPATETVVLFGSEKVVTIDAVIDERIANTELSRWLSRSFQETIESVCRQNSAGNADQIGARGAGVRPHQGAS